MNFDAQVEDLNCNIFEFWILQYMVNGSRFMVNG